MSCKNNEFGNIINTFTAAVSRDDPVITLLTLAHRSLASLLTAPYMGINPKAIGFCPFPSFTHRECCVSHVSTGHSGTHAF